MAWGAIALSLILIGMRLSQLNSWQHLRQASVSLGIKVLLVPLVLGLVLLHLGITRPPQVVIVLQVTSSPPIPHTTKPCRVMVAVPRRSEIAIPPALATLVIAEVFDLERDLTVTALAGGSKGLLLTLPVWLLFGR